jgi:hypothetical protein
MTLILPVTIWTCGAPAPRQLSKQSVPGEADGMDKR